MRGAFRNGDDGGWGGVGADVRAERKHDLRLAAKAQRSVTFVLVAVWLLGILLAWAPFAAPTLFAPDRVRDDCCAFANWSDAFTMGAAFMAFWAYALLALRAVLVRRTTPLCARPTQIRLRIDADGMRIDGETSRSQQSWAAVHRVLRARRLIGLMLSGGTFLTIPADALPDGMTMADVLGRIEAWRAAADPAAPPPAA